LIQELNPTVADTNTLDSTDAKCDQVCRESMTAALAAHPRSLIAFGRLVGRRWREDCLSLDIVSEVDIEFIDGDECMVVTLEDTWQVRVYFAAHPSAFYSFDTVLRAMARAHELPISEALLAAKAGAYSVWSRIVDIKDKVTKGTQYAVIQVDGAQRFVLADKALTHNCQFVARSTHQVGVLWMVSLCLVSRSAWSVPLRSVRTRTRRRPLST
jgi:hypothetical protein